MAVGRREPREVQGWVCECWRVMGWCGGGRANTANWAICGAGTVPPPLVTMGLVHFLLWLTSLSEFLTIKFIRNTYSKIGMNSSDFIKQ